MRQQRFPCKRIKVRTGLWLRLVWAGLSIAASLPVQGAEEEQRIEVLELKDAVYYDVRIKSVSPSSVFIQHSKGLASIPMSELPPDLRRQFGYNEAQAEAHRRTLEQERRERLREVDAARRRRVAELKVAASASQAPERRPPGRLEERDERGHSHGLQIHRKVDFRPELVKLTHAARAQGLRPSCTVFAMVGAMEFRNFMVTGEAVNYSQEYLIWATFTEKGLDPARDVGDWDGTSDIGFSILEVSNALSLHGVATLEEMPNTFGVSMSKIQEPSEKVIESARDRTRFRVLSLHADEVGTMLAKMIHAINNGYPIVIGASFPPPLSLTYAETIHRQEASPTFGHAVLLVGYENKTGRPEDTMFIFLNSWGSWWGVNGYGYIHYEYLEKYMWTAVTVDVVS